jgi:hypothetical protein
VSSFVRALLADLDSSEQHIWSVVSKATSIDIAKLRFQKSHLYRH